jgi:hypothetical protein
VSDAKGHEETHALHKNRGDATVAFLSFPVSGHHLVRMSILPRLASDHVLDTAYEWLCQRRRDYSTNSDVWRSNAFNKKSGARLRSDVSDFAQSPDGHRSSLFERYTDANRARSKV